MRSGDRVRLAVAGRDIRAIVVIASEEGRPLLLEFDNPDDVVSLPTSSGGVAIAFGWLPIMRARDDDEALIEALTGSAVQVRHEAQA